MASRDMALRDAFHYQLAEYIQPLDKEEYQKFWDKYSEFKKLERIDYFYPPKWGLNHKIHNW